MTDRAAMTVKALEEYVVRDCLSKGRTDVLDRILEFGYELRDDGAEGLSVWVGEERVLQVRLNVDLPGDLLN